VSKGGDKLLLNFKEESPGHHVENEAILNALEIAVSKETLEQSKSQIDDEPVECNEGCEIAPKPVKFNA